MKKCEYCDQETTLKCLECGLYFCDMDCHNHLHGDEP